jgi:hypothetical protein
MTELEEQRKIARLHSSSAKHKGEVSHSSKRQRFFKLLKGGDVPRIAEMNDLKNGNVIRGCCWYGDKKEALDTGLHQNSARKGGKGSPDNKRNA